MNNAENRYDITTGASFFYMSGNMVYMYADLVIDSKVDHAALQYAADLAMKRFPYLAVETALSDDGDRYILKTNNKPLTVVRKNGYVTADLPESNDYLVGISYYNEHIFIAAFHGLTDGSGLKKLSQVIIQGYYEALEGRRFSMSDVDVHDSPSPAEWEDPYAHTVELENIFTRRYRESPSITPDLVDNDFATLYSFTVPEDVVVDYAKKDEGNVSGLISLALARAIDIVDPDNDYAIHVACPMDMRKILGCEKTLRNCTKSTRYELTPELRDKPQNVQLSCLKAQMLIQSSAEYQMPRYHKDRLELEQFNAIKGLDGKKAYYAEGALKGDAIVSYLGKIDFGELNDRVKDVFIYGKVAGCAGMQCVCVCFKNRCRISISYNLRGIRSLKVFVNELLDFSYEHSPVVRIDYESPAAPVEVANYVEKYFTITDGEDAIRCKAFLPISKKVDNVVIAGHGFAGHKESRAISTFANILLSCNQSCMVLAYDLPGHGEDGATPLRLFRCDRYITAVRKYIRDKYPHAKVYYYGTSFGGYLPLKYAAEHNMPFEKVALRCPAVTMLETLNKKIINEDMRKSLREKGFCLSGFDVFVRLDPEFLEELEKFNVEVINYDGMAKNILVIQGTEDELLDWDRIEAFCKKNNIRYFLSEGADHRFVDGEKMKDAIYKIIDFFEL